MTGMWIEVSGADGRDYLSARKANEDWRRGVEFKDNTTGVKVTIADIGPTLNVAIRYKNGERVTNAERPSDLNPDISETEARAILENLSEQQTREWKTIWRADQDEIEIDLSDKDKPETETD